MPKKISKDDLIANISDRMKISENDTDIIYQEMLMQIQEAMAHNQKIRITNLGTFYSNFNEKSQIHTPKLKLAKKIDQLLNK